MTDKELSAVLFTNYPDVVNVDQLCEMLGNIGKKVAYRLLRENDIEHLRMGKIYRIPKLCIFAYLRKTGNLNYTLKIHQEKNII